MSEQTKEITFTKRKFKTFQKLYNEAVEKKATEFEFAECTFLVDYAKYVIEYMRPHFYPKKKWQQ